MSVRVPGTRADWHAPGEPPQIPRYELVAEREAWSHDSERFRYQALFYPPKGRPRRLFERMGPSGPIHVSDEFGITSRDPRLEAVRPDASVIATLALLHVAVAMRFADWLKTIGALTNIVHFENSQLPAERVAEVG